MSCPLDLIGESGRWVVCPWCNADVLVGRGRVLRPGGAAQLHPPLALRGNTESHHKGSTTAYQDDNWSMLPPDLRGTHPCFDPQKDILLPPWKPPSSYWNPNERPLQSQRPLPCPSCPYLPCPSCPSLPCPPLPPSSYWNPERTTLLKSAPPSLPLLPALPFPSPCPPYMPLPEPCSLNPAP